MTEIDPAFEQRNRELIERMAMDDSVRALALEWIKRTVPYEYAFHFKWMGMPIIQLPADMVAIQEIIWRVRPQLIVETGVARGGSVVFHASLLELLGGDGRVLGVEIGLRPHNRAAITGHPMFRRIDLIDGSSIAADVIQQVKSRAAGCAPILVILDADHTHDHVLRELELYSELVTKDSYMIVLDTVVDDLPSSLYPNRPWGPGNNPKSAVRQFLSTNRRFVVDQEFDRKLVISSAPSGYLRCIA